MFMEDSNKLIKSIIKPIKTLADLEEIKENVIKSNVLSEDNFKYKIIVHLGTCGIASGADKILEYINQLVYGHNQNNLKKSSSHGKLDNQDKPANEIIGNEFDNEPGNELNNELINKGKIDKSKNKYSLKNQAFKNILLSTSGCVGFCALEPMFTVYSYNLEPVIYYSLTQEKVDEIFKTHIIGGKIAASLEPINSNSPLFDFFKFQESRVLRNRGKINPFSIEDYIASDGYFALNKILSSLKPEEVIKIITDSGLRGRGGAGFPTGKKWQLCRDAKSPSGIKYVVCNGDEGDPGAFMDRNLLESDPHSVIEGMLISAYAIGSQKGYVYVRAEYPLAVKTLENAIQQARKFGLLGNNIFNSNFSFDIEIYQGAGAFVCGEETALLRSLEGKRGMPRPKPPFPANEGLYGMPTLINNVETFANVPQIILNGAEWFNSIGTQTSKGTKIFALAGAVKNVGLVEVPMGMSLRDIIYKIGGGISGDGEFKAVQLGGPSGGCIPEKFLDIPVDYEKIKEVGSIVGSGGMIVLDDSTCMANLARYFMDFIQEESCGQCVPCRIGTRRMLEILERITKGKGQEGDIEKLERLAKAISETSLCGLGKTAPNPVFSTLKYFREEFEEHIITQKSCERLHPKVRVKKI